MSLEPEPAAQGGDATSLFEEVLARRERGEPLEWDALARSAGSHAEELRARLALLQQFEDLSCLLAEDEDEAEAETEAPAPERIGRYELGELLGEGGLSRVFRARDELLGREVALKLLSPTAVTIAEARHWMMSEGRLLAQLEHESIVRVFDVDEHKGFAFIAMERVGGASLFELLEVLRARSSAQPLEGYMPEALAGAAWLAQLADRCRLVARLARALDYCHARGVVHRDVKPGNVLVDPTGVPKLIDFGLSHSARDESTLLITQRLAGTVAYLSPEQVDQGRSGASPASDQFSLGVMLYELLTLQHPFARQTHAGTMTAISRALPPAPRKLDPTIPLDLERITLHALERLPGDRYASLGALADDLEAFLEHRAIRVQAPSPLKLARLWLRRHRAAVAAVCAGVLAAAALWFGNQLWSRVSFRRTARAERAAFASVADTVELEAHFRELRGQWIRAGELDSALLAGLLLPRVSPELRASWEDASERLHAEVDALYTDSTDSLPRVRRERLYLDLQARWRGVLAEELYSAPPGVDHVSPLHFPGQVLLPEGGELLQFDSMARPEFPVLRPVEDRTHLEQGSYRFVQQGPGGSVIESEFRVFLARPRWSLEPVELGAATAEQLVPVAGRTLEVELSPQGATYPLDDFEIAPRPITWAELEAAFPDGELDLHKKMLTDLSRAGVTMALEPDAPALPKWSQAREYLERTGGRLPTAVELYAAQRDGLIELPTAAGVHFDWVGSHFGESDIDCYAYAYKALDPSLRAPDGAFEHSLVIECRPDSFRPGICFRVARSRQER